MLTKPEAEKQLIHHYQTIKQCLNGGWQAWLDHYSDRHFVLDSRARAAIVYCEIIHLARTLFADTDVKIVARRAFYVLYMGDDIALRFKKLRNGVPSNIRTRQQELISQQLPIPGILPGTYVSAGYELDRLEQAIAKTLIVARLAGKEVWSVDLSISAGDQGGVEVITMPTISHAAKARHVRVRKQEEAAATELKPKK